MLLDRWRENFPKNSSWLFLDGYPYPNLILILLMVFWQVFMPVYPDTSWFEPCNGVESVRLHDPIKQGPVYGNRSCDKSGNGGGGLGVPPPQSPPHETSLKTRNSRIAGNLNVAILKRLPVIFLDRFKFAYSPPSEIFPEHKPLPSSKQIPRYYVIA